MTASKTYSLSRRLTVTNLAVSAAALAVACAAFFAYDEVSFRDRLIQNLSIQAEIIGANSVTALLFADPESAGATLSALKASPHIVSAVIYTPDRNPFATYPATTRPDDTPKVPGALPLERQTESFADDRLQLYRPILLDGKLKGIVLIESDLSEIDDRRIRYGGIAVAVLAISLLAALAVSGRLKRAISEPVVRLANTARAVSTEENYSLRAAPTDQAELSVLVDAFNAMLERIQRRDAELIEARRDLEQRVEERTAQLAAANKELEAFSYSVSHDLRAPLRHIDGFATLLADRFGASLDPAAQRYLSHVRSGARNMGQLVDDLLHLARIGRKELVRKPTDTRELVNEVVQGLQMETQGRPIVWRVSDLPVLNCDAGLMRVVFTNLLSNAAKYTRKTVSPLIEVDCVEGGDAPVIRIRDNGAGFDQQYVHKLFGVFQRLHRSEEFEGTGVGLATVQRIIHKHGGTIWAEGEIGRGAAFSFRLRAQEGEPMVQADRG